MVLQQQILEIFPSFKAVSPETYHSPFYHHPDPESTELTVDSRLEDLSLDFTQVDWSSTTWEVAKNLEHNRTRAGIILTDHEEFQGMISRRRFWEQMSRPYSLDLFAQRPIQFLYPFVETDILILNGKTPIVEATQLALKRPADLVYEPLVVCTNDGRYGILDTHHLLMAHAHIHLLTTKLLQQSSQQLEAVNLELKRLASLDGLTEIANRRHFNDYLCQVWHQCYQVKSRLSLILIDVDYFKRYNDAYGHLAGDDCLRQVAKTLQKVERNSHNLVARYGGEEFGIILPHYTSEQARQITSVIQQNMNDLAIPHTRSKVSPIVTLSMGVATCIPSWDTSPQDLVQGADDALYRVKKSGRNGVFFAEELASLSESDSSRGE
ncbi:GGDEF domain-containing protein [Spirulina subsalsa FACHB-351]|uniref:GGDEF domain-containing protein n=1 Tax=Spirulina subsalsa FACHB-351 TaxID=234711 RepID=A0ABT3L8P2_9CYAN|nr:GGDEF domain-containing protein [Spirulina subsalsa]MCW6037330.1 GGDEF domain-containing protein [Spirulina subsalsa FACHB-351]